MKNLSVSLVIFLFGSVLMHSCRSTCDKTVYYNAKIPVYGSLESIRSTFDVIEVQPMDTILRIVELGHAYFLEEKGKGVHVIDKLSAGKPNRTAFIEIPGCLSIEGNGNTLYIGQATDLIVVDVTDLNSISQLQRIQNVFNADFVKEDSFIIDYTYEYVEWVIDDGDCADSYIYPENVETAARSSQIPQMDLHITNDHLIACDNKVVNRFGINSMGNLFTKNTTPIGSFGITAEQQISSTDDFIVVGNPASNFLVTSNDDMFARLFTPNISSPFSCGKFFLFNDVVFFTDFSQNPFGNCITINALHVRPINSFPQTFTPFFIQHTEPQYVSILDSTMLLCDGAGGLAFFDISMPTTLSLSNRTDKISTINAQVSVHSKTKALVWGTDGLFQIDLSNPQEIIQEFKIE